jgi:hypothetical protein
MNFLDIYQPPFRAVGTMIFSANNVMSLMALNLYHCPEKMMDRTVDILNGKSSAVGNPDVGCDGGEIYVNGDPFLVVRGWGHLIGSGALNLPENEAAKIQDEFAVWVVRKIRGEI